jgi:uncharacterized integral membrane protein
MARKIGLIMLVAAAVIVALLALQNRSDVEISFLFWNFHAAKYAMVLVATFAGLLAGFFLGRFPDRRPDGWA